MKIQPDSVVALTWILQDGQGGELDRRDQATEYFLAGGDLLPAIVKSLQGLQPGAVKKLHLEPHDAFGDFDAALVFLEARALFPEALQEGMLLDGAALPEGVSADMPRDLYYTVTDIYPDHVVLDGNHPLAGMALNVEIKVCGVRAAGDEERAAGTVGGGLLRVQE